MTRRYQPTQYGSNFQGYAKEKGFNPETNESISTFLLSLEKKTSVSTFCPRNVKVRGRFIPSILIF